MRVIGYKMWRIAWGGPIVMNTRHELTEAFRELDEGTFIKHKIKYEK